MEVLENIYKENPSSKSVNLEFLEIEDLESLVPILAKFENLNELLLYGNSLQSLPNDMSLLNSVRYLDISNNSFSDVENALDGLKSLVNLTHLAYEL